MIERCQGKGVDAHYLGFFDCFNRQLYFEAHEVLEDLWLEDRHGPNGDFYKGLIQLAGAFVHVQKTRPGPAAALLKLARANLLKYGAVYEHLDVAHVLTVIGGWLGRMEGGVGPGHPLTEESAPQLELLESASREAQS